MPDVTASYGMTPDFIEFFFWVFCTQLMPEELFLHQTFINFVFDVNIIFCDNVNIYD